MMLYDFEKLTENKYQVRLGGELVTYVEKKSPDLVDAILSENGFKDRKHFFESRIQARIHREALKQSGEIMGQYAIENAKMKAALHRIMRGEEEKAARTAADCIRVIYGGIL